MVGNERDCPLCSPPPCMHYFIADVYFTFSSHEMSSYQLTCLIRLLLPGKPVNRLAQEEPTSAAEAMDIIDQVSDFYDDLISGNVVLSDKEEGFYLPSK